MNPGHWVGNRMSPAAVFVVAGATESASQAGNDDMVKRKPKTAAAVLSWWLIEGDEECPHCGQLYLYELEFRCPECDTAVCLHCRTPHPDGHPVCPSCLVETMES